LHKYNKFTFFVRKKNKVAKTKLRDIRLNKGLSQEVMADLIGMTQSNYSRRENGRKAVSEAEWTRITKALDVNKETIYEANRLNTSHDGTVNVPYFNIPSQTLEYIEFLKNENSKLKEQLKFLEY
jgi:transcriptional regulator with XRE-family HTH domain